MKKSGLESDSPLLCPLGVEHINIPGVAPPSQHLLVLHAQKVIAIPELVRHAVCHDARRRAHLSRPPRRGTQST